MIAYVTSYDARDVKRVGQELLFISISQDCIKWTRVCMSFAK